MPPFIQCSPTNIVQTISSIAGFHIFIRPPLCDQIDDEGSFRAEEQDSC